MQVLRRNVDGPGQLVGSTQGDAGDVVGGQQRQRGMRWLQGCRANSGTGAGVS